MKTTRIAFNLSLAAILLSCNNNAEKKEETAEAKKDSIVAVEPAPKPQYDTIDIYRFKGGEPFINTEYIKNCSEGEKALLAYYSYFFSTNCKDTKHCALTEALGLGEQTSKEHRELVLKWFTDDETMQLAKENGKSRITPDISWYEEIKLVKKNAGLIIVRYISDWKIKEQEGKGRGTDEYQLEDKRVKVIGRQHEDI